MIPLLKENFPQLKIIARGEQLKVQGPPEIIDRFEEKLESVVALYEKRQHLSRESLFSILSGAVQADAGEKKETDNILVYGNNGALIRARTKNQELLVKSYEEHDLVFAEGPAGTGKTYTAIALAVRAWKNKEVRRIILTRPAVEAGEQLGFLPGDMKEKLDPYLQPLYDALRDMIPAKRLESLMEEGVVQIAPLAYMRGRTLDHACVILDEAQNTSLSQLKMFLTRMGKDAKFIITGDTSQIDLVKKSDSGLSRCMELLRDIRGIAFVRFDSGDIIRHPLVKKIVAAFATLPAAGSPAASSKTSSKAAKTATTEASASESATKTSGS
ncbi:MAG TPA: PhoH family protein [Bacteroidales bacterium]|nr:PhoH family protein [Bacteroidales bacterium]MCZ2416932.1 PhoH family protein [Burkholderiales bacterium]HNR27260.1 PhoH family protein [Bacteroidales bacterium]HNT47661.1 PhoH family protein [Bacteroidales bacterium]HNZ46224.1 PhoH family protein [Bacteroidales bacterium]